MKFVDSSGRIFTSYEPSCQVDNNLQDKFNVKNGHDFRSFLQQNSEKVKEALCVHKPVELCKTCPVCKESLDWKPTGDAKKSELVVEAIDKNENSWANYN